MTETSRTARRVAAGLAFIALAGCEAIGNPIEVMRGDRPTPDEFAVITRGELMMPPGLDTSSLPEPSPGLRSPLEPDPQAEAIAALTGREVAASTPRGVAVSRGEAALLAAANASAASPEIRAEIARENEALAEAQPYEPPTIFELFSGGGPDVDPDELIDPVAESQRLQEAGVPAPVDQGALQRQALLEAERAESQADEAALAAQTGIGEPRFWRSSPRDSITAAPSPGQDVGSGEFDF
ncbi:MAG: DUF3035 domain-containing protein [Pikeienuella sp.]